MFSTNNIDRQSSGMHLTISLSSSVDNSHRHCLRNTLHPILPQQSLILDTRYVAILNRPPIRSEAFYSQDYYISKMSSGTRSPSRLDIPSSPGSDVSPSVSYTASSTASPRPSDGKNPRDPDGRTSPSSEPAQLYCRICGSQRHTIENCSYSTKPKRFGTSLEDHQTGAQDESNLPESDLIDFGEPQRSTNPLTADIFSPSPRPSHSNRRDYTRRVTKLEPCHHCGTQEHTIERCPRRFKTLRKNNTRYLQFEDQRASTQDEARLPRGDLIDFSDPMKSNPENVRDRRSPTSVDDDRKPFKPSSSAKQPKFPRTFAEIDPEVVKQKVQAEQDFTEPLADPSLMDEEVTSLEEARRMADAYITVEMKVKRKGKGKNKKEYLDFTPFINY